ncbi:MAG: hypothetical protein U9R19_03610 [Bacteroidota bacterium]|nr:hypothetical protein [Bacteroidota bacterium]
MADETVLRYLLSKRKTLATGERNKLDKQYDYNCSDKKNEEREFYLRLGATESYSKKELQRQLDSGLFERTMLSKGNISPVAREIYPYIMHYVREYYDLDFLGL